MSYNIFATDHQGRRVFITPNVKPSKEMIESLVKAVHGQVKNSDIVFDFVEVQ